MKISIIAAVAENGVIGKDNDLLWRLPNDVSFFKNITSHHPVIMGRKTWESIPEKYRPLPNRTSIVLSGSGKQQWEKEGYFSANSIENAINVSKNNYHSNDDGEVFVAGGGQIYKLAMPMADKLYITHINHSVEGDTYFPEILENEFKVTWEAFSPADSRNKYSQKYRIYERIKK